MTEETPIATIRKNSREEIRVGLGEYEGHSVAHVRVWFRAADGSMRPSKSGLTFRVDLLPELADAVSLARQEAERQRLVPPTSR
jgi:hypothetical protein